MTRIVNASSFLFLVKGITVVGTPERVDQYLIPDGLEVIVTARRSNTQNMYIANSSANATGTNRKVLIPGQSTTLRIDDTNKIWFDADNTDDRIEVTVQRIPSTGGS